MTTMDAYEAIRDNDKATAYANTLMTEKGYTFKQAAAEAYLFYVLFSQQECRGMKVEITLTEDVMEMLINAMDPNGDLREDGVEFTAKDYADMAEEMLQGLTYGR